MSHFLLSNKAAYQLAQTISTHLNCEILESEVLHYNSHEIELKPPQITSHFSIVGHSGDSNMSIIESLLHITNTASHTLILPYLPYCRQDKAAKISALRVFLDALVAANATVITLDVHGHTPISDPYNFIEITHCEMFSEHISQASGIIVSPDKGGLRRLRQYQDANFQHTSALHKERTAPGVVKITGNNQDFDRKDCIIIDDIVDSANTICSAARFLKESGAKKIKAFITHNLLNEAAVKLIEDSPIDSLILTNSVAPQKCALACGKIQIVDVGHTIARKLQDIIKKG